MPTVIHATHIDIDGPIVVDRDALERLDRILARESQRLKAIRDSVLSLAEQTQIEEEKNDVYRWRGAEMTEEQIAERLTAIRARLPRSVGYREELLEITLKLKSGKKIKVSSFEEASRSTELIDERVTDLEIEYVANELDTNISKGWLKGGLSLKVRPETSPNAGELYSVLKQWCESTRSHGYMNVWFRAQQHSFVLFFLSALIMLFAALPIPQHQMKQRAVHFARDGVRPGQEGEALQTLLAMAADYEPTSSSFLSSKHSLALLLFLAVTLIVVQFAPKFEIGLGVGTARIDRARTIGKLFFISVPLYILALLIGHYWK